MSAFLDSIVAQAKSDLQTIVLPEGADKRTLEAARREILEETSIRVNEPLGTMEPLYVREGKTLFKVYPFHFDSEGQEPVLNEENEGYVWASVEDAKEMKTVTDTVKVMSAFLS